MSILYENPLHALLAGSLLVTGFGGFAWVTGRRWLWALAGLSLAGTIAALVVESVVVTDREQIHRTLDQMVVCVRNNDMAGLRRFLSERRPDVLQRFDSEMPRYTFRGASISRRGEPEFDDPVHPGRATIRFTGFVNVDASRSEFGFSGLVTRGVTLTLVRDPDGVWRVTDYEHYEPRSLL